VPNADAGLLLTEVDVEPKVKPPEGGVAVVFAFVSGEVKLKDGVELAFPVVPEEEGAALEPNKGCLEGPEVVSEDANLISWHPPRKCMITALLHSYSKLVRYSVFWSMQKGLPTSIIFMDLKRNIFKIS
jgi:hypothetical protein